MAKVKNIIGQKFGRLIVKSFSHIENNKAYWSCDCDCGNKNIIVSGIELRGGNTSSCGCLKLEHLQKINEKHKKYNTYDLTGEYGIGYTSNGKEFYFDLEDYDKIKDYCWNINNKGYVTAYTRKTEKGKRIQLFLHRVVLNLPENKDMQNQIEGEHYNRNPLDNRKENLKIVNHQLNMFNKKKYKNNSSGVTGVDQRENGKWRARLWYKKKMVLYEECDSFNEAVKVRKEAEEKYFGKYSYDNSQKYLKQINM